MVTKRFTLVDIRDVYFHDRRVDGADAVVQGYTGVRIGTGVQHDAVLTEAHLLNLVNQFSLYVALEVVQFDVSKTRLQHWQIVVERLAAVDTRFADAQQIQVWAIQDEYLLHDSFVWFCGRREL